MEEVLHMIGHIRLECGNVNVRTSPTTTSGNNVLFQVHNGYQFTILQEQNGWYQVSFGADRIGWISGLYVTLI